MKRPLVFITIYYLLGIIIGNYGLFTLLISLVALFILSFVLSRFYQDKRVLIFPIFTIISILLVSYNLAPKSKELESAYNNEQYVKITGVVNKVEKTSSGTNKLTIKVNETELEDKIINKKLKILTYINNQENIYPGEEIYLEGYLQKPKPKENPTDYDEELNFKIKQIDYKIYPKEYSILGVKSKFKYNISRLNEKLSNLYYSILPEEEASILSGMILGNKKDIDKSLIEIYKNAGIYHILAISGLHISLIASFLSKIFDKLTKKYGAFLTIFFLILYCILTGGGVSVTRSAVMYCVVLLSKVFYKRYDIICSACIACLLVLIHNPMYLFDIGFLYSYFATFSIAFIGNKVIEFNSFPAYLKSFVISFFVSLAIKPITAYYFYSFNLVDIFLNIIILPFMSIIVVIGFLSIILALISIDLASFILNFVYYILRFFTYLCLTVDRMDFSNIIIGKPGILNIVMFYLMLILIGFCVYDKHRIRKRLKYAKLGILAFSITFVTTAFIPKPLEVTTFSLNSGESTIFTNNDFTFIVDAGDKTSASIYSESEKTIIPYLNSKGIKDIDAIFITKNNSQYIDSVIKLLEQKNVKSIFVPDIDFQNSNYYRLFEVASNLNIKVFKLKEGDSLNISDKMKIDVLEYNRDNLENDDLNLVLKLDYKENEIIYSSKDVVETYINSNEEIIILSKDNQIETEQVLEVFNTEDSNYKDEKLNNIKTLDRSNTGAITINIYDTGNTKIKTTK